jgi:hypothetical protein
VRSAGGIEQKSGIKRTPIFLMMQHRSGLKGLM